MDSYFFDDIIEYLIIIGVGEHNDNDSSHSGKSNCLYPDFLIKMKEKKKKMTFEDIKKTVYSIVENSVLIIINVMRGDNEVSEPFGTKVKE